MKAMFCIKQLILILFQKRIPALGCNFNLCARAANEVHTGSL